MTEKLEIDDKTKVAIMKLITEKTVAYRPIFGRIFGPKTGLYLSQCLYRSNVGDKEGWFAMKRRTVYEYTGLRKRSQIAASKILIEKGILEERAKPGNLMEKRLMFDALFQVVMAHLRETDEWEEPKTNPDTEEDRKEGSERNGTSQNGTGGPNGDKVGSERDKVGTKRDNKVKEFKRDKKKEKKRAVPAPGPDSTDKLYRACSDQFYIRYASEIAGTDVDMAFIQDHPKYKPKYSMKDWNALKWMREEGLTPQMVNFFWSLAARDKSEYVSSSRLYIWFYKKEWNYYHKEWMKSSSKQSQDRQIEDTHRKRKLEDRYLEDVDAGREVPREDVAKVFHGIAGNIAKSKNLEDT